MNRLSIPTPGMPDPKLPDWGPYSKKYFGISHIADHAGGVRFDCFVMPQLLHRKRELPDALSPCGLIPEYAAPEQTSGKYDKRVDIYSLGLVLYELSNQFHLPFAKSSYVRPDDVNMRMPGVPLPPPSGASKELCAIILRACAFKAEDRYQTAQEFANALIAFAKQTSGCSSAHPIITNDVSDIARPVQGGSYSTEPAISSSYNTVPAHEPKGYETMPAVEIEQEVKRDQYQTVPAGSNDLSVAQKAAPAEKKTESEPSFAELLEQSIKTIAVGDKVNGIVTFIDDNNIHVDLGTKHVGYLPLDEFSSDPLSDPRSDVKIGDEIEVFVLRVNDREGTVLLSKKS
jgi:serine/threonine protein kinase